jgi:hypothetical protein
MTMTLLDTPYETVKSDMVSLTSFRPISRDAHSDRYQYLQATGKGRQSFLRTALEEAQDDAKKEELAKWAAASMYSGGADTVRLSLTHRGPLYHSFLSQIVSSILSFFLAMSLYPKVQAKAQSEIDQIIGTSRLPSYEDRNSLPYLDALVMEVLRWNPTAPLGKG